LQKKTECAVFSTRYKSYFVNISFDVFIWYQMLQVIYLIARKLGFSTSL